MTAPVQEDRTKAELAALAAIAARLPSRDRQLANLSLRHGTLRDRIVTQTQQILRRLWTPVNVYDERAVEAFAKQAADTARKAQEVTSQVTEAYLHQVLQVVEIPTQGRVIIPDQLRPADPVKVYARPAETQRFLESTDTENAAERAVQRLDVIVDDDMGLAFRQATKQTIEDLPQVIGYRRILHPELSISGPCGLCIVASDRVYKKNRLMPLHGRCRCGVLPVFEEYDPGKELNAEDLKLIYELAGSTEAKKLKRVRATTKKHGELGEVLRHLGHDFKGPEDI